MLPVTVTTYVPPETEPTVKLLLVKEPEAFIVHEGTVAKLAGVIVHAPASLVENPLPVTNTRVPITPEVGLRVIVGPCTVKLA